MFKLESYITPIILSYVDKYIKNFRAEDSQVSLWGGDVSFNNLDLRLEVLEQELHLPFTFVSGHIHELLIHVPWTKITSEPITITINTIECILKLRGHEGGTKADASHRKKHVHKTHVEAPPGYVQSVVNKIVSNIRIYCNNLILKYVEEDIVLSMNIKLLTFESADQKWEPAYTDIPHGEVTLRKLIKVYDLTVCMDKRNAAGKIEVYQEPMLYRCSMTMHLLRSYYSATAKRTSTTRLDLFSNNMEFSMTEQQVPMLMRVIKLLMALFKKQLKPQVDDRLNYNPSATVEDIAEHRESWAGWAWSFVPSIFPVNWDDDSRQQDETISGHTLQIGFYMNTASLTFKVSEYSTNKGYYHQRKLKYWPLLSLHVQGLYYELINHGKPWISSTFGISEIVLFPVGYCSCSARDVTDAEGTIEFLRAGSPLESHLVNSLFDTESPENKGLKNKYNFSWDYHMETLTESALLERTPAFVLDFVHQVNIPDDISLSDLGPTLEFSNFGEKSLLRVVFGPLRAQVCSGFFHRLSTLHAAASTYDYQPYYKQKPRLPREELPPPSEDDFEAFNEGIPMRVVQITVLAPVLEIQLMDHPFFKASREHYFTKRRKIVVVSETDTSEIQEMPKLTVECQCIDVKIHYPFYGIRLVSTTCQLPDPPERMFNACHLEKTIKIIGFCSRLILGAEKKYTTIITPSNATYDSKTILVPEYWKNPDIPHKRVSFETDSITLTGTNPKLTVVFHIVDKLIKMGMDESFSYVLKSSLFEDASSDFSMAYLEYCVEGFSVKMVKTKSTNTYDIGLGSLKAFIFNPVDITYTSSADSLTDKKKFYSTREIEQIIFISGPEAKYNVSGVDLTQKLFSATIQHPRDPEDQPHPPILIFNMQEIRICVDPLFCKWLLYTPTFTMHKTELTSSSTAESFHRTIRNMNESHSFETPRRSFPHESIHSTSDKYQKPQKPQPAAKEETSIDVQEKIYNVLKKWFHVWKGLLLCGDLSRCTIYFPVKSLSAIGLKGMQETVKESTKEAHPPEILVLELPYATIRSTAHRKSLESYLHQLPIKVPDYLWNSEKLSFPWTISVNDLSVYTLQFGKKMNVLMPVSVNATVGLSTKPGKSEESQFSTKTSSSSMHGSTDASAPPSNTPSTSESSRTEIGTLGVCIHVDVTPISIWLSEVQVCLISSVLYGITEVIFNLASSYAGSAKASDTPIHLQPSSLSSTLLHESTLETTSETSPQLDMTTEKESSDSDNTKLTAWIQGTITKLTVSVLAHKPNYSDLDMMLAQKPDLKLVLDTEDIVSSLDFQNVYLKIKSKIGSANVQHYEKDRSHARTKWTPGPYLGLVMRGRDDASLEKQENTSFASITITRASCKHTHNLWGTLKQNKRDKENSNEQLITASRFITEVVFTLQPIDFVLSPTILKDFLLVFEPISQISNTLKKPKKKYQHMFPINNTTVPLAYLELKGFKIIVPCSNSKAANLHDICMLQIDNINLNPNPENPICRTPCRPDVYQQAAEARILQIPGSDVEDRQYQLEINGVSISTGIWNELSPILKNVGLKTARLKTMSENPALEWNNLGRGRITTHNTSHNLHLWQVMGKFNTLIIAAPAMVYKKHLICNHSVEINFTSDIEINISLSLVRLSSQLLEEIDNIVTVFFKPEHGRSKVMFPYPSNHFLPGVFDDDDDDDDEPWRIDSGFETPDFRTSLSPKESFRASSIHIIAENAKSLTLISKPVQPYFSQKSALEILVTGGRISLVLFKLKKYYDIVNFKSEKSSRERIHAFDDNTSEEKKSDLTKIEPLLYISISQSNSFISNTQLGQKIQFTCFDVCIKVNGPDYPPITAIPKEDDFHVSLLETRSGEPNRDTGILPAFFTLKWTKAINKTTTLDLEIAKPTKILFSIARWGYLIKIHERLLHTFKYRPQTISQDKQLEVVSSSDIRQKRRLRYFDQYERFKQIETKLKGISLLNVRFSQIVLTIKTDEGAEVNLSIGNLKNTLSISSRIERVVNVLSFECMTLGVAKKNKTMLLLNPWAMSAELCLFWESWQDEDSDPQISVSVESDSINLDVSPAQIECLKLVINEISDLIMKLITDPIKISPPLKTCISESNQYYKDDLRAGAFQFVDASTNNIDELPLPYQVMFWSRNIAAMAWRYPQPRALTKVRVFPVPFKVTSEAESNEQILCHLEFWSDSYSCYQPFTRFYLSESEMCHLDLPTSDPKPIIACVWRVLLTTKDLPDDSSTYANYTRVPISPRALAGCIRIDSYFAKSLVPDLTVVMNISSFAVSLYNHINKEKKMTMPPSLRDYMCDLNFPETQCFLTLNVDNIKAYLTSWNLESFMIDVTSNTKCSVLDYAFLTLQTFVEPFNCRLKYSLSRNVSVSFIAKPMRFKFGSSLVHTLVVSSQIWNQNWHTDDGERELVIVTPYVFCNNCNVNLRFGQAGYEEIILPTRFCHMYSWRSQKCKQMIRVALEDTCWIWSEPFRIDQDGTEMLKIGEKNITLIVTIKSLSTTQKQVTFSGQFVVCNMLLEHFEFKIVEAVASDKDKAFKNAQSYMINGKSSPPSLIINTKKKHFLRLRFFGLDSAWSGDIPLMENTKSAQPWLVKVPLQERGQFLSIWCRIVVQQYPKGNKVLAMLWPLFMVRSNLPVSSKVQIDTPTLNVHLESTVRGKGEYQQLYCPGTIDHSHQLSLQLDSGTPTSNPYVPLNYSLVDQKEFFRKSDKENIDDILSVLREFDKSDWPYFDNDIDESDYVVDDQPLTHVQVRYQNACDFSSTLLVELLPWCLLINTLGCPIAIIINEKELCRISHHGIVAPPKLEETFHIGVGIGNTWNMSLPLQLAKSDWSQVFYMPKITGTIPMDGSIKTAVKCGSYICMMSLISCIANEIRLLRVCSSHVITNHLNTQIRTICFAVPDTRDVYDIPKNLDKHCITVAPHLKKSNVGVSVIQWYAIGKNIDSIESHLDFALYISFTANPALGWSCPIRVDKNLIRRSLVIRATELSIPIVLVSQEYKGQTYLSLHHDIHPQMKITNYSGIKLFFAQSSGNENTVISDCEHFKWICSVDDGKSTYYTIPILSEKFPELPQTPLTESLVIASDPEGDPQGFQWSNLVNLSITEQFVRIPFYGDVKITSSTSTHTLTVIIESVAQVEINAQDIRVRLLQHETEILSVKSSAAVPTGETPPPPKRLSIREETVSISSSTLESSYYSAEESGSSEINLTKPFILSTVFELNDSLDTNSTMSLESLDKRLYGDTKYELRITAFLQSVIFTLTSDLANGGAERTEMAALTCDNIVLHINRKQIMEFTLSVSEIQLDNQMYQTGSFDFPVVLVGQKVKETQNIGSINYPLYHILSKARLDPLFKIHLSIETWWDFVLNRNVTDVKSIRISILPLAAYIEDVYVMKLIDYLSNLIPNRLILWPKPKRELASLSGAMIRVPAGIIWESSVLAKPLILASLCIDPVSVSLSIHSSIKLYIALDQSPLQFGMFERKGLLTTPYRLGHALTMHYLSGAIFGAGWVVGSLELLGSPGGLARAMGTGLRDFVSLPCSGLLHGPWAFLRGVTHGSASLMKHVTAGTLQSVTKLASSVARNLDRLTLDEEHLRRTEEQRRQKPQGVAQGFLQGLTGLGISLLGAVGGIAHHPLQSVVAEGASPRSLMTGVGLGIVGVFTKPLSGAADLVALTGQGLLQGAGWNPLPQPRMNPISIHVYSAPNALLKYNWKYTPFIFMSNILFATEATCISNGQYEAVALILTLDALVIANTDEDMPQRILNLTDLRGADAHGDPTLLTLKLNLPNVERKSNNKNEDEEDDEDVIVMDPTSRARVADYVRSTVGLMSFPDDADLESVETEDVPEFGMADESTEKEQTLSFYVNPQNRNYFLCLLDLAKQQKENYNFPVF